MNAQRSQGKIKVVGCGGASIPIINQLKGFGEYGVETIFMDTDGRFIKCIQADRKVLMKRQSVRGHITCCWPEWGKQSAELSEDMIREAVEGTDFIIFLAGLGGNTATGAAPVITRISRGAGAIMISVVCTPFNIDKARRARAKECVSLLEAETDLLIVLDNHKLLQRIPGLQPLDVYPIVDGIIVMIVKEIVETIKNPGQTDIDPKKDYANDTCFAMIKGEGGNIITYVKAARRAINRIELPGEVNRGIRESGAEKRRGAG